MKNPKNPKFFLAALLIAAALALVCTACGDKTYTVKYEITGPATVASLVIYRNSTGGSDEIKNINIPWSLTFDVSGKNILLSCGAGFGYSTENTYTAKIYVNGKQVTSSTGTSSVVATYVIE